MADSPPTNVGFERTRQNEACVYFLLDPDTKDVRCIGSTRHIQERRQQHVSMNVASNRRLAEWFDSLRSEGTSPVFYVLTVMHGNGALIAARQSEKYWIHRYASMNDGHLILNEAHNPRREKQRYWSRRPKAAVSQ